MPAAHSRRKLVLDNGIRRHAAETKKKVWICKWAVAVRMGRCLDDLCEGRLEDAQQTSCDYGVQCFKRQRADI